MWNSMSMGAATAPCRIIQKKHLAHVLWGRTSNTTGYVVFESYWWRDVPVDAAPRKTRVLSVSRPSIVMPKGLEGGKLKLGVLSPYWQDAATLELALDGSREIESADIKQPCEAVAEGSSTRVEPTMGYLPMRMTLAPAPRR